MNFSKSILTVVSSVRRRHQHWRATTRCSSLDIWQLHIDNICTLWQSNICCLKKLKKNYLLTNLFIEDKIWFDNFESLVSKCTKFIKYWPQYVIYGAHILSLLFTNIWCFGNKFGLSIFKLPSLPYSLVDKIRIKCCLVKFTAYDW